MHKEKDEIYGSDEEEQSGKNYGSDEEEEFGLSRKTVRGEEEDSVQRKTMSKRGRGWLFGEDDGDKRKRKPIKIIEKRKMNQ